MSIEDVYYTRLEVPGHELALALPVVTACTATCWYCSSYVFVWSLNARPSHLPRIGTLVMTSYQLYFRPEQLSMYDPDGLRAYVSIPLGSIEQISFRERSGRAITRKQKVKKKVCSDGDGDCMLYE